MEGVDNGGFVGGGEMVTPPPYSTTESRNQNESDGTQPTDTKTQTRYMSKSFLLLKTVLFAATWTILGMASSMSGPALPSLRRRINVNTEEISLILTANSLGSVAGNLPLGILGDLLGDHLDLIVSLSWLLGAAGCLLVPFATSLVSMVIFFFIMGVGLMCGVIGGSNFTIFKIWGDGSATGMAATHFGYGVGAMIAPLLAEPFIGVPRNVTLTTENGTSAPQISFIDRIDIPYYIIGALGTCSAVITMVYYIHGRVTNIRSPHEVIKSTKKSFGEIFSYDACPTGSRLYSIIMMSLFLVYAILMSGGEETVKNFLYTFATENRIIPFTKEEASTLNSIFWFTFTVGRLVTVVACKYISLPTLVGVMVSSNLVNALVLGFFGWKVRWVLWVWTGINGFCSAPLTPVSFAWIQYHLKASSFALSVIMTAQFIGMIISQILAGTLMTTIGHEGFCFVLLIFGVGLSVICVAIQVVASTYGKQFRNKEQSLIDVNKENIFVVEVQFEDEKPSTESTMTRF